jgi:putative SOS response-associated peptidase YedK
MCGRFTLHTSGEEIAQHFALSIPPPLTPRYNIAPSQEACAIRTLESSRDRSAAFLRWGLIPRWAKEPKIGYRMINARAESVAEKPAFRAAFRHRRCLIPADGFYEWRRDGRTRQPFHLTRQDGGLFAFAGLWEQWRDPDAGIIESFSIVTTRANDLLAPIHNRMPVILPPDAYPIWIDPGARDPGVLEGLLTPFPSQAMKAVPVSPRVNSPGADDPNLILAMKS